MRLSVSCHTVLKARSMRLSLPAEHRRAFWVQGNIFGVRFLPQTDNRELVSGAMDYSGMILQRFWPLNGCALSTQALSKWSQPRGRPCAMHCHIRHGCWCTPADVAFAALSRPDRLLSIAAAAT